ncbi:MAG: polysaccharide lyase [Thiolinea sp.]
MMKKMMVVFLILFGVQAGSVYAEKTVVKGQQAAVPVHKQGVRMLRTNHATQPFDMAAKLQWNPHAKRWDKVLVLYNGAAEPVPVHPVWNYLKSLRDPKRPPRKKGENIGYQAFRLKAHCTGKTPLDSGKPIYIHFNQNKVGHYREEDYFRDWNCPDWQMGLKNSRIVNGREARDGKQSLRLNFAKYRAGCSNELGCYNWKPELGRGFDSLYYSYWVKFPKGFDFVLGGKLPGIGSRDGGTGGGKPSGVDGWSVRAMWDSHGKFGQYVYHVDQPKHFGDFMPWDNSDIELGKWYQIKTFVRLNTPGQRNGVIRTWLNNRQVMHRNQLRFRNIPQLKIERFLFSAFFGGTGPEWAPSRDMILYMDDFIISPRKI